MDGVSLTHGPPGSRQHIWTVAAGIVENNPSSYPQWSCPCADHAQTLSLIPSFVGNDYFCESSVQGRLNFFFRPKLVHAWCFETILITNCYIFGSNEGIIRVLCTLKINHKHFVSMETAPPIVNKAVINALRM